MPLMKNYANVSDLYYAGDEVVYPKLFLGFL